MEFSELTRVVIRFTPLFLLCLFLGFQEGEYVNNHTTPVYQASSTIFISTPPDQAKITLYQANAVYAQTRMLSYAQIISTPLTLDPVIKQLGLSMTSNELSGSITAVSPLGTVLLYVTVTGNDPEFVKSVANAVANQFIITVNTIETANLGTAGPPVKATIARYANAPTNPISPKRLNNILAGLVGGLSVALLIIFVTRYFDDSLDVSADISPVKLLGSITLNSKPRQRERKKFKHPWIEEKLKLATNSEIDEIALRITKGDNEQIIGISPVSRLANESTFAFDLAKAFSEDGFSTLLVDAVFRGNTSERMYLEHSEFGLLDLLEPSFKQVNWNSLSYRIFQTPLPNLSFLPHGNFTEDHYGAAKIPARINNVLDNQRLEAVLEELGNRFDYVIVSCDEFVGGVDASVVLHYCDGAILLIEHGRTLSRDLGKVVYTVDELEIPLIGATFIGVPPRTPAVMFNRNKSKPIKFVLDTIRRILGIQ